MTDILAKAKSELDRIAEDIATLGYYRPYTTENSLIPRPTLSKFARQVAKELKRPFVEIWSLGTEPVGFVLTAPKRKYLMPLIHPLILAGYSTRFPNSTLWKFHVGDSDFAKAYLESLSRPEMRKALRLPP